MPKSLDQQQQRLEAAAENMPPPAAFVGLADAPPAAAVVEKPRVNMVFQMQLGHANWKQTYKQVGGRLDAAASPLAAVFHLSGNRHSVHVEHDSYSDEDAGIRAVSVPVERAQMEPGSGQVRISPTMHMGIAFLSRSFTLDGTIGATVLGQGTVALTDLLRQGGNAQVQLQYSSSWHSPTAVVSIFGVRFEVHDVASKENTFALSVDSPSPLLVQSIARVPEHLKYIVSESVRRRTKELIYPLQPNLTKSVAYVTNGLGGLPYMLLGSILDGKTAFSTPMLAAALEFALKVEMDMSDSASITLDHAYAQAQSANLQEVADVSTAMISAISTMVATQMSYRVDGAPVVGAKGAMFEANENWAPGPPLLPGIVSDDCDRSAMMGLAITRQLTTLSAEDRATYPVLQAYSALLAHYDASLVVLAAKSAEASGDSGDGNGVAGHAVVVVDPKASLVRAMLRGVTHAKNPLGKDVATRYVKQLWTELVADPMVEGMNPDLKARMQLPFDQQKGLLDIPLFSLAIEGTTPAFARLYEVNRSQRDAGRIAASRAKTAMRALGAGMGRGLKDLSSLGPSDDAHGFYRHLVERTSAHSHPLWASSALREIAGGALQQLVYVPTARGDSGTAGATPKEVRLDRYALLPLAFATVKGATDLDVAAVPALENVMPSLGKPLALSREHALIYKTNREALEQLAAVSVPRPASASTLLYVFASNALVSNEAFISNALSKIGAHAHDVVVHDLADYYVDSDGTSVGYLAAIAVHV